MNNIQETAIEHCGGDNHATVTAAEQWSRNLIIRLAQKYPRDVQIIAVNNDGSILAHVPFKWVKIRPPRTQNMTDEQKRAMVAHLHNQ